MNAPAKPDLLAPVREVVAKHRSLSEEAAADLRADLAKRRHLIERDEARDEAIDGGYFERDPYSRYVPPKTYEAPCGCAGRFEEQTDDGESTYDAWVWTKNCSLALDGVRDE